VRAFAHTCGDSAPTADSASGGSSRHIPHLPVTPAVRGGQLNWIALLSGLVGVMIGSLTSIVTLLIQNAYQNRRESQRLIFDTAFKDYELRFRYASESTPQRAESG